MRTSHALWALPLLLAGCGGGGSSSGTGTVDVSVTDAPVDGATAVVVHFDSVELKPADGESVTFDALSEQTNMLTLQNGETAFLLDGVTVEAGRYNWIRLHVNDENSASYIELNDGSIHPLMIPSVSESGLKLNRGFTVEEGGAVDLTIDFDLRKSVHKDAGDYKLRPTLRIVQTEAAGSISGTVPHAFSVSGTTPADADADLNASCAAYVYEGTDVTPDDEGSATPPVASGSLALDGETSFYTYTVSFLEAGAYTIALTCDAADDQPDTDDPVTFSATHSVTVTAGETVASDFQ